MDATSEAKVMSSVLPKVLGDTTIPSGENLLFGNLYPLTKGIRRAKPGLYHGIRPELLDRQLREKLSSFIIPSTQPRAPILPTFFAEVKGPDGSVIVAQRQACYEGVLGARGFRELELYEQSQEAVSNDSAASVIVATYAEGVLRLYTIHATPYDQYKMTLLQGFFMSNSRNAFVEGARAIRNARDWTMQRREKAVANANQRLQAAIVQSNDTMDRDDSDESIISKVLQSFTTSLYWWGS
ncbi:MAG: hypothetical protein M1814_002830 [Vezdaea aestivalis]|nr:MAG: hypothetical protein M1814_002830 [Vezdaea aestivalis]